jgi:dihydropyrimidinase
MLNALLFENPARIFGLWPSRGAIRPGASADLIFYDPDQRGVFDHRTLHNNVPETAVIWDGVPRHGVVIQTIRCSEAIYADDVVARASGNGRQLARNGHEPPRAVAGEVDHEREIRRNSD